MKENSLAIMFWIASSKSSLFKQHPSGKLFFWVPQSTVSTLRGSYGRRKSRCFIGVLQLGAGIFLANFRIQWFF